MKLKVQVLMEESFLLMYKNINLLLKLNLRKRFNKLLNLKLKHLKSLISLANNMKILNFHQSEKLLLIDYSSQKLIFLISI